jgi:hypothetical protein
MSSVDEMLAEQRTLLLAALEVLDLPPDVETVLRLDPSCRCCYDKTYTPHKFVFAQDFGRRVIHIVFDGDGELYKRTCAERVRVVLREGLGRYCGK